MCSLLPSWVVLRDLDNNFLAVIQVPDLSVVPSLGSKQVYVAPLGSPSTVTGAHSGQTIISAHPKRQDKDT